MRYVLVVVSLAVLAVGCGGPKENRAPTAPVRGVVTYQGEPVPTGTIYFYPDGGGVTAEGHLQPDGSYVLGTYSSNDGAIIGSHKVMIYAERDTTQLDAEEDVGELLLIPAKYTISPDQSGLTANVSEGNNEINFALTDD